MEENVAPNHDGKSAPYGSGYKRLKKAIDESLRDWFKKEDPEDEVDRADDCRRDQARTSEHEERVD